MDILSAIFRQQSRRIGILIPSVVVSEKHSDALEITEHPVEKPTTNSASGFIADHAYKRPSEVTMECGFAGGGSLLDAFDTRTIGFSTPLNSMSPRDVYAAFLDMQQKRELLSVTTGKRIYKNMLIKGIEVTTDKTTENVLSITLTLREVILTSTQKIQVAAKADMALGENTAVSKNAGTKTLTPPDTSLYASINDFFSGVPGKALSAIGIPITKP
ncbi:phage baseplate protein [Citrobacter sp. SL156]